MLSAVQHSENGESLKSRILHFYGEKTAKHIRIFGKLQIKKTKLIISISFLLRCRDHDAFRRWGSTRKKAYSIQNTPWVWNQELFLFLIICDPTLLQETFSQRPLQFLLASHIWCWQIHGFDLCTMRSVALPLQFLWLLCFYREVVIKF